MGIPSFTREQLLAGAPGRATALTIGVLDGVHRGHQALLARLREEARGRALSPGVVTLHPHPVTVLRPEVAPSYLTSLEDRIQLVRDAGAEWVIPLTFTGEVSEVTAEEPGAGVRRVAGDASHGAGAGCLVRTGRAEGYARPNAGAGGRTRV